jgi:large-conductance mechanosensitive channel
MKIYKPKILKNGAIGGYVKKNRKIVWRLLTGPKTVKGGAYTFDNVNKRLTSNINFLNITNLVFFIKKKIEEMKKKKNRRNEEKKNRRNEENKN